jgi:hypothetical protein
MKENGGTQARGSITQGEEKFLTREHENSTGKCSSDDKTRLKFVHHIC